MMYVPCIEGVRFDFKNTPQLFYLGLHLGPCLSLKSVRQKNDKRKITYKIYVLNF